MANLIPAYINGKAYEWNDIECVILGTPVTTISKIDYSQKQEMTEEFGAGPLPVAFGYGKRISTCKITMLMNEIEAIQNIVASGILQDIPLFDIIVSYTDMTSRVPSVRHIIRNCRFKDNGRSVGTGDQSIKIELELSVSHIQYK
jgi:hypothetical protein